MFRTQRTTKKENAIAPIVSLIRSRLGAVIALAVVFGAHNNSTQKETTVNGITTSGFVNGRVAKGQKKKKEDDILPTCSTEQDYN